VQCSMTGVQVVVFCEFLGFHLAEWITLTWWGGQQ
jgi:hypothetical protein